MSSYTFSKHNKKYIHEKKSEELSDIAVSLYEQLQSQKDKHAFSSGEFVVIYFQKNIQNKFKASIPQLQEYLQVDDSEEAELQRELKALSDPQKVLSEARKKWKHLQKFVYYIPKAMQAIGFLKRNRILVAHPSPIFLNKVEEKIEQMETSYGEYNFPMIKQFIISMRKVLKEILNLNTRI